MICLWFVYVCNLEFTSRSFMKYLIVIILLFFVGTLISRFVYAQEAAVKVVNVGASNEVGGISFGDIAELSRTNTQNYAETVDDTSFNPRKWFKIEDADFILEPKSSKNVRFSIDIPKDAEPGGHYATIFFEPRLPSFYFAEGATRNIPQPGVLFLLNIPTFGLEETAEAPIAIAQFQISDENRMKRIERGVNTAAGFAYNIFGSEVAASDISVSIIEKTPLGFILRIKNEGITHVKPFGKLVITNFLGMKVGETEVSKTTILPGKIRLFPVNFSSVEKKFLPDFLAKYLLLGRYKARLVLQVPNYEKGTCSNEQGPTSLMCEMAFWSFPWKAWLGILVLAAGLVLLRRRIKLALEILIARNPH